MQKYIKDDLSEIRYFEDDVIVKKWIDLKEYRLMTPEEVLKHETQKSSEFHTDWNGSDWVDNRTDEEKQIAYFSQLKNLTRRQFKLVLLENNLLDQIENAISAIEDDKTRARIQIEYVEAAEFHRSSDSVIYMCDLLELSDQQINTMWEQALKL